MTISSCTLNNIYAGISPNNTGTANTSSTPRTVTINNCKSNLYTVNSMTSIIIENNSEITQYGTMTSSNTTLNVTNSNMTIKSTSNQLTLGATNVTGTSVLTFNNGFQKEVVFSGNLTCSLESKLVFQDRYTVYMYADITNGNKNVINVKINEDTSNSEHYINLQAFKTENTFVRETINLVNEDYELEFSKNSIAYWKFYKTGSNGIESAEDCVYIDVKGDDTNNGTIQNPIATIKKASEIINNSNGAKQYIVLISDIDLSTNGTEGQGNVTINPTPIITTKDTNGLNFKRKLLLNATDTKIYQNMQIESDVTIASTQSAVEKNIHINGNAVEIKSTTISGKINLYADGTDFTIQKGTWNNVYGGSHNDTHTSTKLTISGGTISNVYGGSNVASATITGETNLTITGGTVTNAYGGNYQGTIEGDTSGSAVTNLTITGGTVTNAYGGSNNGTIKGSTLFKITGGKITNTYGGNYQGTIEGNTSDTVVTNLTITGGTVTNTYGGSYKGTITGNTNLYIKNVTISGTVYGGSNSGTITGTIKLEIEKATITGKTYGGSNGGTINGSTSLSIISGTFNESVFAGGYNTTIEGQTELTIVAGTFKVNVYGGNNTGTINGNTSVTLNGGTLSSAYGGNYGGTINGSTNITISGAKITSAIYGGNRTGTINGNTSLTITGGTISNAYGGNYQGTIQGDTSDTVVTNLTITGGTISNAYGGSSDNGTIKGNTNITISGEATKVNNTVYGGNNTGNITGSTNLEIQGGTFANNIYGGSYDGDITGSINLKIENGTIDGNVYGGNKTGNTIKNININITGGTFGGILYGKDQNANNNNTVNVISIKDITESLQASLSTISLKYLEIENAKVLIKDEFTTDDLTLGNNGHLILEGEVIVTDSFVGVTNNNDYGKIEANGRMTIKGNITGITKLEIGKIIGDNSANTNNLDTNFPEKAFINDNIKIDSTDTQRTWTVGNIDSLEVIYVDGVNGDDSNTGENSNSPLKTLKMAYYYLKDSETPQTIVICGNTTLTQWPENATKKAIITSKYSDYNYAESATLTLLADSSTIGFVLNSDTTFENINILTSTTTKINANKNNIKIGEGVIVQNGKTYLDISGVTGILNIESGAFKSITTVAESTINIENTVVEIGSIYPESTNNAKLIINTYSGAKIDNINNTNNSKSNNIIININAINESIITTKITKQTDTIDVNITNNITEAEQIEVTLKNAISATNLEIANGVTLKLDNNITNITIGTLNLSNSESGLKIPNNLTLKGNFKGGGYLYLVDNANFNIEGQVSGTTSVIDYDDATIYCEGTTISATSDEEGINHFEVGRSEGLTHTYWNRYGGDSTIEQKIVWTTSEIEVGTDIFIDVNGSDASIGIQSLPLKTLKKAYEHVNARYEAGKGTEYRIILLSDISITEQKTGVTLNENVTVTITSDTDGESLKITKTAFEFEGKTILENIGIDTTGINSSVEFFVNGYDVIIGDNVNINSKTNLYPILYGGSEATNITGTNLKVQSGKYNMIFGGNKSGNITGNVNLDIGDLDKTNNILNVKASNNDNDGYTGLFGGSKNGKITGDISLNIYSGEFYRIYGAGQEQDAEVEGNIIVNYYQGTTNRLYGGGQNGNVNGNIQINSGKLGKEAKVIEYLRGSGQYGSATNTEVTLNNGTILELTTKVAAGGFRGNVTKSSLIVNKGAKINCDVYGGGWGEVSDPGTGSSENTSVTINEGAIINGDVYGGGYVGPSDNTNIIIKNATIAKDVYGGGNEGIISKNTSVTITSSNVNNNVYGGGRGTKATVQGDTIVIIDGNTVIGEEDNDLNTGNVFGGGNSASSGSGEAAANTNVYIAGGTIYGDIYGGANTSTIYGNTNVKIGKYTLEGLFDENYNNYENIDIKGTVFGGGKSNTAGSENYDFSFISVTGNTNININGKKDEIDAKELAIGKSIFASGNAATIAGEGNINVVNYGTEEEYKEIVSIQRANTVTINNSNIRILGTTDRTNEISTAKYTLNRMNSLTLKNNSVLYLDYGVNIVKDLYSVDINGNSASVTIKEDGTIEANTNNKIFMQEGKNILLKNDLNEDGSVNGTIFIGKYKIENDGTIYSGIYGKDQGQANEIFEDFTRTSYVQAMPYEETEGNQKFYTNELYTEGENTYIKAKVISPLTLENQYSQWIIEGTAEVIYYEDELIASKYSSHSQAIIEINELKTPNANFEVISEINFESNINSGIYKDEEFELVDSSKITNYSTDANTKFALTMSSGEQGWIGKYETSFLDSEDLNLKAFSIVGSEKYESDSSIDKVPNLIFDFVHSKNITEDKDLGSIAILLKAYNYEDDGNNEVTIKNIVIILSLYTRCDSSDIDYYEGAISPGIKYRAFPNLPTNITAKSDFSVYYSIYLDNKNENNTNNKNGKATEYNKVINKTNSNTYHCLVMDNPLPVNTKIVLLDKSKGKNEYYYYVVSENDSEKKTFYFNEFIVMGSDGSIKYSNDKNYYNNNGTLEETMDDYVIEEFIIQTSFKDAEITSDYTNTMKIQLINDSATEDFVSDDYKIELNDELFKTEYTVYKEKEPTKTLDLIDNNGLLNISLNNNIGTMQSINIKTNYIYQMDKGNVIYDTTNFDNAEGLKITFEETIGGATTTIPKENIAGVTINGYTPREDGSIRIPISDVVSNIKTNLTIDLSGAVEYWSSNYKNNDYSIKIQAIGSIDGVSDGNVIAEQIIRINFYDNEHGFRVDWENSEDAKNYQIVDKIVGYTLNNNNLLDFNIGYYGNFQNPKIKVGLARRDYTTVYNSNYIETELSNYIRNILINDISATIGETYKIQGEILEETINGIPENVTNMNISMQLKDNLTAGTYKINFKLYDGEEFIGEAYKMIIIK